MTAEEHIAVQRESKARTTLLQSIHDDHVNQLKAKTDAKDINLKFLRALPSSWSQVALTLKTKGGLEFLSFDDLYYKLKTLEVDVKGYNTFSSSQSAGPSYFAFVSATSTSKKMSYRDSLNYSSTTTYSVPSNSKTGSHRSDLEQIEKLDLEEMDLKWKMAMLSVKVHKFEQKARRKINFDKKESARFNKKKVRCYKCQQSGHFSRECRAKGGNDKKRYSSFKIKEIGKKEVDSKALITVDTLVDWRNHNSKSDGVIAAKEFGMIAGCDSDVAIKEGAAKLYNLIIGVNLEEANTTGAAGEFALIGVTSEHKPTDSTSCASTSSVSTSMNEAEIESNVGTPIKEPISVLDLPSFPCNSSDKNEHTFRTSCNKNGSFNKKAVPTGRYVVPTGRVIVATGRDHDGSVIILPPMTVEEHIAVQRESKARTTLLQSILDDHAVKIYLEWDPTVVTIVNILKCFYLASGLKINIHKILLGGVEKVSVTDLFYLRGMYVGSVDIPYLLAMYLRLFALGRKHEAMISGGQFLARLAWVASGPERQQVVVADAPEAVEDAPIADEGAPAVPAPVQAPQAPHPVARPSRTMAHRLARVEENMHEIQGGLGEQIEMMSQAGVRYTSYADFQILYVRRTRRKTNDASISTAQHDEQPDP
uniref:CCHC-type domain-containing protein n=1 Tax=Tanacetum cinerariifolium TaxID=118510 RepID=A0A6L2NKD3_TANCI|nr:hypothetical protein [Tanacetum cinerariifolium]